MEQYYFLFALAFVWMIFAVIQDLRTTFVSNWLNFSLVGFALAYRAFYSVATGSFMFLFYGVVGFFLFMILGYLFNYGRVFAGGDTKLFMSLGAVLPFEGFNDYLYLGFGFVFLLFSAGAVYTLIYSFFMIRKDRKKFAKNFGINYAENRGVFYFVVILALAVALISFALDIAVIGFVSLILILWPLLFFYAKAIEKTFMICLRNPGELLEGDWLVEDVRLKGKTIRKSINGLTLKDIELIKKTGKKIWIRSGVPFTPAFLIAFLTFVFLWIIQTPFYNPL